MVAAALLLALPGGTVIAQSASAHGGDTGTEGYVIVQQALGHLFHDSGPVGTADALKKMDEFLAAKDQEGVAVGEVRQAKAALTAGKITEARNLLQSSITEAVGALKPATGEETGTRVMLGQLPPRGPLSGTDWAFLTLSAIVALVGAALALVFRPRESLRDLRRDVQAAANLRGDPSRTASTRKKA